MAGVISPSMPLYELMDEKHGTRTYSNMNEGIGKVLRYGAYSEDVIERLKWMGSVFAPVLKATIEEAKKASGRGIYIKTMIAQVIKIGDIANNSAHSMNFLELR